MMPSNTYTRRTAWVVVVCALLATGAWGAAPSASSDKDVTIANVAVQGQQVRVTVVNSGAATSNVTLTIRVTLADGTQTAATSTAVIFGRQQAFLVFPMPSLIKDVPDLGMIVDDPAPF